MGTNYLLFMEANKANTNWETSDRRNSPERNWIEHFYGVFEVYDGSENAGVPLRRRERLAEAEYDT